MKSGLLSRLLLTVSIVFCLGMVAESCAADQVTVYAKLIWATNHSQPPDQSYQRADEQLSKDLQQAFKWKNYFVITSKEAVTEKNRKLKLKMSEDCRLQITYLGDDKFEVVIWGKDPNSGEVKPVAKGTQKMEAKQKVLLMGVSDNESGWVVKLCRHED
jgi:hypothetical protein